MAEENNQYLIDAIGEEWILKRIVDAMRKEVEDDLESGISYGDELRALYRSLFKTHYELLKLSNPQWTVGKTRLVEWRRDVDRLEEIAKDYSYVTRISKKSAHLAKNVLPKKIADRLDDENMIALAAIRSFEDKRYAAGCIVYHLEESVKDKQTVFVDWLYVAEQFRNDDVANSLMAQMFLQLADTKVDAVFFDYDASEVETQPVLNLLRNWHFALSVIPDYYHTVSLLECQEALGEKKSGKDIDVKSLSEIDRDLFKDYLKEAVSEPDSHYDEFLPSLSFDSFDAELSCYTEDNGRITGLFLIDKDVFGRLEVLMLRADSENVKEALLHRALDRAIDEYTELFAVRLPMRDDEEAQVLSQYFKEISPYALMRAVFLETEFDIDDESWDEQIAVSRFSGDEQDRLWNELLEEYA